MLRYPRLKELNSFFLSKHEDELNTPTSGGRGVSCRWGYPAFPPIYRKKQPKKRINLDRRFLFCIFVSARTKYPNPPKSLPNPLKPRPSKSLEQTSPIPEKTHYPNP
jgi:hypothetical protein